MKKIKNYSMINALYGLVILVAVLMILNAVASLLSLWQIARNNTADLERTVSSYGSTQQQRFSSVRHYVEWTVINEPTMEDIEKDAATGIIAKDLNDLRSRILDMRYSFGNDFMFFVYANESQHYYSLSQINISYGEYLAIRDSVIANAFVRQNLFRWNNLTTQNGSYLYYAVTHRGITMIALVPLSSLTDPLDDLNLGRRGYISMKLPDHTEFLHQSGTDGSAFDLFYNTAEYPYEKEGLPYTVRVRADILSSYGEQLIRQLIMLAILFLAELVTGLYLYRMFHHIMMPLEDFNRELSGIRTEDGLINLDSRRIQELAQASSRFHELVQEIQHLRIGVYEDELARRKFEITFLQHQIRPHFYLNCLSTIGSMAELGDTKGVQDMVKFTSRYMRYLFQADQDFVMLEFELYHIRAYLDIQNMRMGQCFTYEENIPNRDDLHMQIPPLLLITFIENCVKHAQPDGNAQLTIHIDVTDPAPDRLLIQISDSGQGFSEETLSLLQRAAGDGSHGDGQPSADGHHIGIYNCIRRLSLLYNEDYSLQFSNSDTVADTGKTTGALHGAHILLEIPRRMDHTRCDEVTIE